MSSMVSPIALITVALASVSIAASNTAQQTSSAENPQIKSAQASGSGDGSEWDRARALLLQSQPSNVTDAIERWKALTANKAAPFESYASFLVTHPGWPDESQMRRNAEAALNLGSYAPGNALAYFAQFPPLTQAGKARYAVILQRAGQNDAAVAMARQAWRGGSLAEPDKAQLLGLFSSVFTAADHDARMDALLWAKALGEADSQLGFTSALRRPAYAARLAMQRGAPDAAERVAALDATALGSAGYIADRVAYLSKNGDIFGAQTLLAKRPTLTMPPVNAEKWYELLLANARSAAQSGQYTTAFEIASKVDDVFPAGHDVSGESLGVRDDYTSLVWLAGTLANDKLGQPAKAVGMFVRYGSAARTPQTRSKGYYWAGRAAARAQDATAATQYFEQAGAFPDHYYGQLAMERLGRALPALAQATNIAASAQERGRFNTSSLVQATQTVARNGDWSTQRRFFGALAAQAQTPSEHLLVADLARQIGRRDLAVIVGQSARSKGIDELQGIAFPQMPLPSGFENSWTMIHAITRQESQYAQNAVSHAGARGLMQLMPGTAREQAEKMGLSYDYVALTDDPSYNIRLGSGYFARMLDYYGGSYPLAVAAYNAGPGNVNKWLRANGDPRMPGVDMVSWIEQIPIFETRNYVQRVLENAVVYDGLNPERARMPAQNRLSRYLGKSTPG